MQQQRQTAIYDNPESRWFCIFDEDWNYHGVDGGKNKWTSFFNETDNETKWNEMDWDAFLSGFLYTGVPFGTEDSRDDFQRYAPKYSLRDVITKFVKDGMNINDLFSDIFRYFIDFQRVENDDFFEELFFDDLIYFKDQLTKVNTNKFFNIAKISKDIDEFNRYMEWNVRNCEFAARLLDVFWEKLYPEFHCELYKKTEKINISEYTGFIKLFEEKEEEDEREMVYELGFIDEGFVNDEPDDEQRDESEDEGFGDECFVNEKFVYDENVYWMHLKFCLPRLQ